MNNLENSRVMIEEYFESISKKIKSRSIVKSQKRMKNLKMEIQILESEIQNFEVSVHMVSTERNQNKYYRDVEIYKQRFQKIIKKFPKEKTKDSSKNIDRVLRIGINNEEEIKNLINSVNIYNTDKKELIEIGDHFYERALEETKNIEKDLNMGNSMANEINTHLNAQNEELNDLQERIGETKLLIREGKKKLVKMVLDFYKDKIILILCIIVLLLCIVLIALKINNRNQKTSSEDQTNDI